MSQAAAKGATLDISSTKLLLNISEAATLAGISRTVFHRLLNEGQIPYLRVGADRRIVHSELLNWISANTVKARR